MHAKSLFLVFITLSTLACRKGDCPDTPTPPKPGPDIPALKLRDMSINRLPAPYYHFTYNDSGYITQMSHASGMIFYDFTYAGKRILKIEANKDINADINKDRLEYEYLNELPVTIKVISKPGVLYRKCLLDFSPANQLQQLSWQIDLGTGFVPEQTLSFSYYPDGNLKQIDYHQFAVGPFLESRYADAFENYDTKTNVDDFSLLHTPLHHPILLPAIRLQLNNPGRVFRTGALTATYDARYNYTYDAAGRPLTRSGPVTFKELNGTTGEFISQTTYSYF